MERKYYFDNVTEGKIKIEELKALKNTGEFIENTYGDVVDLLKGVNNQTELDRALNKIRLLIYNQINLLQSGEVPIDMLSFNISLQKEFSEYKANTQAVQAAVQIMDEDNEDEYQIEAQFDVVLIKTQKSLIRTLKFPHLKIGETIRCSVRDISQIENYSEVDKSKYVKRMRKSFKPILDEFNIGWEEIMLRTIPLKNFF